MNILRTLSIPILNPAVDKMDPQVRILIAGYFGFDNAGDELILDAMIRDFRANLPEIEITVTSGNPENTKKIHHVNAVGWENIPLIISEMDTCDMVIIGGGGVFHDYWGFEHTSILTSKHIGLSFYSSIAILAAVKRKPLMLYGVGVGPLITREGNSIVRTIANQAARITVRDDESQKVLLALGIHREKIRITADPAFSIPASPNQLNDHPTDAVRHPLVGVALRNWDVDVDPAVWEREVAAGLDDFLGQHPAANVLFIPFQNVKDTLLDDTGISKRVQRWMTHAGRTRILKKSSTFAEREAAITSCDLVAGMRLHAIILAMKYGLPVVALSYDPKITNLMTTSKLDSYVIPLIGLAGADLERSLERAYQNRASLAKKLHRLSNLYSEKSKLNIQAALDILNHPRAKRNPLSDMNNLVAQTGIELAQQNSVYQEQVTRLELEADNLAREIDHYRTAEITQKAEVSSLATKLENLSRQMAETQVRHKVIVDQMGEHSRALKIENGRLLDQVQILEDKLGLLTNEKQELTREIGTLVQLHEENVDRLTQRIMQDESSISHLSGELNNIKGSRGWKMLWAVWQIRQALLPHRSRREQVVRSVVHFLRKLKNLPSQSIKQRLERTFHKHGLLISRYAYPFLAFKRKRDSIWHAKLSALNTNGSTGLVSIILPVYNGERYIAEAVESILNQTYQKFELILVDDGSTDSTARKMDEYAQKDPRIRVVHQKNQKLPRSLNNGFLLACGEYLTWSSDDNRMKPEFLEKMVTVLQRHPDWDMVYANMDIIGENGQPLTGSDWFSGYQVPSGSEHIHLPADRSELNTWPNNYVGGAFLYRRRINYLLAGYSPHQFTREDYDYWMQVNSLFTLKHVPFSTPVYDYRFHTRSLTSQDDRLKITNNRKYLMVFDDFRRDFYLAPLVWILEDGSYSPREETVRREVIRILTDQGQIILSEEQAGRMNLPHLWLPCIHLHISSKTVPAIPPANPGVRRMANVLLCVSDEEPTDNEVKEWDIRLWLDAGNGSGKLGSGSPNWWSSTEIDTLIKAVDIKVRSEHLRQIESETHQSQKAGLKISVIICTFHHNTVFETALRAAADQTMPLSDYEVVVVDNNPEGSGITELIDQIRKEEFAAHPDHLRLIHCPVLGLSFARNAGIAEAKSDILLFLDDDAIAKKDILEQYWNAFSSNKDAGLIGGHIILRRPEKISMIWREGWERYWSQFKTDFQEYTPVDRWWDFPWGANWCARRRVLMQIGGFRSRYGRRGKDFQGGEEIVAASLIQRLGYTVAVLPQAEVIHQVDQSRFTLDHLKRTIQAGIFTHYQMQRDLYLPFESNLRTDLKQFGSTSGKLMRLLFHPGKPENRADALESYYLLSARVEVSMKKIADGLRRLGLLSIFLRPR